MAKTPPNPERAFGLSVGTVLILIAAFALWRGRVMTAELLAAAGIKQAPKTWAEYREAAKKMTLATKPGGPVDQWGSLLVLAPAGFDLRFLVVLRGFGGDFLTPDNKHSMLNSPEAKAAFKYALDMIHDDKSMPPGVSQIDANGGRQLVASRKVAMAFEGLFTVPIIDNMNPKLDAWRATYLAITGHDAVASVVFGTTVIGLTAVFYVVKGNKEKTSPPPSRAKNKGP